MRKFRIKYFLFLFLGGISFIVYAQSSLKRTKTKDTILINFIAGKEVEGYSSRTKLKIDPTIDSLKNILVIQKDDMNKVNILNEVSYKYSDLGNYDSSMYYAERAETLAEKIEFQKGIANAFENIGIIYYYKDNYQKSLEYQIKSLIISRQIGSKIDITNSLRHIGILYWKLGNYSKALEYYFKALSIAQEMGKKDEIGYTYGNIGIIYDEQGDYPKSLEYYFKALGISQEMDDKYEIAINLCDLGFIYGEQGNYSNALEYDIKSLSIAQQIGRNGIIANDLDNIGVIYEKKGNYSQALEYEFKAICIGQEMGDRDGLAELYSNVGRIYVKMKKYKEAKTLLDSALTISRNMGDKKYIEEVYAELVTLDSATGNHEISYKDYKQYIIYRDSLVNEESIRKITRIELKHEFEKMEDSINVEQEKAGIIKTAEIKRKSIITDSVIIILILTVLLAILLINRQQMKQKKDKLIFENEKQKMENELVNAKALLEEYIRSMVEKNTLLEQSMADLENIKKLKAKEIDEDRIEHIEHLNKTPILTDDDWNRFKQLFEQVHKGFFVRLKEKLPDLTPGEIRMICLLKLKVEPKQMAAILCVSFSSIKTLRHRLRKKLGLLEKDSLYDTVNSI